MSLVLVVLLGALAVGRLSGGRLDRLAVLRLWSWPLVVGALLLQLAGGLLGGPAYPVGLAASAVAVLAFVARNRGLRGTGLVAVGLLANALVVAADGAMPVAASAARRAGVPLLVLVGDPRHQPATARTRLRGLGDVVPVPLPLLPEVVSPGDVLVAAGLGQLVVTTMTTMTTMTMTTADGPTGTCATLEGTPTRGGTMAKKGRKKRARKKNKANHGNRPNA